MCLHEGLSSDFSLDEVVQGIEECLSEGSWGYYSFFAAGGYSTGFLHGHMVQGESAGAMDNA